MPPFFKAPSPRAGEPSSDIRREIEKRVLAVVGLRFKVGAESRLDFGALWEAEGLVQLSHLADRILFKLLESDLVKITSADEAALLEKGAIKFLVLADEAFGPVELIRALQAAKGESGFVGV